MLFSLLKDYLDTDTALKVSQSVYCFTTSISHGVENYFPRLWGMGISDAIFKIYNYCRESCVLLMLNCDIIKKWHFPSTLLHISASFTTLGSD